MDSELATAIFRILQETLTNVVRHAAANEVEVRLAQENGVLILEVRDNGIGIAEPRLSSPHLPRYPGNAGKRAAGRRRVEHQ